MAFGTPLKALALVLFIAAIAAATYGVQRAVGDTVTGQLYSGTSEQSILNATPGHTVTYAITILNKGGATTDVVAQLTGDGASGRSEPRTVFASGNATVFVPVNVTSGLAVGDHALTLTLLDATGKTLRTAEHATTLRIFEPAKLVFTDASRGSVTYFGRLSATGGAFNTNDGALAGKSFLKAAGFVQSAPAPLPVGNGTVVPGFFEGILGMQPGESRTVSFGHEKGYGNATRDESVPRVDTIQRLETRALPQATLAASDFEGYLNDTHQGKLADYHVGSLVTNERNGAVLNYRITNISDEGYKLQLDVHVGEKYTLHGSWPNASEVVSVDGANATFFTTPGTAIGANFTYEQTPYWPQMSAVTALDNATITITHSPPVGYRYTVSGGAGGGQEFTVKELTPNDIVALTASSAPLAGKDLTFDIRLDSLTS